MFKIFKLTLSKIKRFYLILILLCFAVVAIGWLLAVQREQSSVTPEKISTAAVTSNEPIEPIPLKLALDEHKMQLGEKLFYDPRLSGNNTISCQSCHLLNKGGTDQLPRSKGITGSLLEVNSPTVFNSGFNFKQFWDGRADNLEDQIDGPILSKYEMGNSSWSEVVDKLKNNPEYVFLFKQTYSDGITSNNIKDAIATFENSLYTPNSRFDMFLQGNDKALTEQEKEGYRLFKAYGCVSCHQGTLLGGNMFQTFGLLGDYFSDRGNVTKADLGRFNVTNDPLDRYVFKVPTLRNIALTPPYFHDGSAKTLEEAIKVMAKYQLGRQIPQTEIDLIVQFLNTLNGEYQGKPL